MKGEGRAAFTRVLVPQPTHWLGPTEAGLNMQSLRSRNPDENQNCCVKDFPDPRGNNLVEGGIPSLRQAGKEPDISVYIRGACQELIQMQVSPAWT